MKRGFTLIELLIVVAIIAILAAIAVPNFLEAQTRAKVSRTKADQRTLATALESFRVDNNAGPSDAGNGTQNIYRAYAGGNVTADPPPNYSIGFEVTTPVAYLSSAAALVDPFKEKDQWKYENNPALRGRQYYNFNNIAYRKRVNEAITNSPYAAYPVYYPLFGDWVIMGAGPDKYVNNRPIDNTDQFSGVASVRGHNYDPTNGTVSNGDVYRSQKYGVGMQERDSSIP
jgi:prepilin-type N-terminal cleavage/methylation domain-containing protein